MPKFPIFAVLMDTRFYLWALLLASSLFTLGYSLLMLLRPGELEPDFEEAAGPEPEPGPQGADELPAGEFSDPQPVSDPPRAAAPAPEQPEVPAAEVPGPSSVTPAERFIRGVSGKLSDLDLRLEAIEVLLSKGRSNDGFAVKFLEDLSADIDALDKAKIKARIVYLLSDLKK